MKPRRTVKDFSDDDSTHTLKIITDVTHQNCVVEEREYTYLDDDDTLCQGVDITLETLTLDGDAVNKSLEDLHRDIEQDVEFDI